MLFKTFLSLAFLATTGFASAATTGCKPGATKITGFYVGGGVSATNLNGKTSGPAFREQIGGLIPEFGLFAGYNIGMANGFLVGLEAFFGLGGSKVRNQFFAGNADLAIRQSNFYGLAARIGYMMDKVLPYLRLEANAGKFQVNTARAGGNTTYGKNRINPAVGVGFDYHLTSKVFLRAEWKYVFGQNIALGAQNQKIRLSKSVATFGVGTNFNF